MLEKLFALVVGVTVVGHLFFRPQLKQLGRRIDRLVTVIAIVVVITWLCQIGYLLLTREEGLEGSGQLPQYGRPGTFNSTE
jgi:hypothetical protein